MGGCWDPQPGIVQEQEVLLSAEHSAALRQEQLLDALSRPGLKLMVILLPQSTVLGLQA